MLKHTPLIFLGIILTQLTLLGCSKDEHSNNSSPSEEYQPHYLEPSTSTSEAYQTATHGQVSCASLNPQECSSSIAMQVMLDSPTQVGACTAFLVSPQIMITNSHCIPEDLKASGSNCSNRIWYYFPDANGYSRMRAGCSQILTASSITEGKADRPDIAVVQLDQAVHRPLLELSREGIQDQQSYTIMKVDPQSKTAPVGLLTRATCKGVHNSLKVKKSESDLSPLMGLGDCELVHGNSGSPLLDASGHVRGLVQAAYSFDQLSTYRIGLTLPLLDSNLGPLNVGTSFGCLDLPIDVSIAPKSPLCEQAGSVTADTAKSGNGIYDEKTIIAKIHSDLADETNDTTSSMSPAFKWDNFVLFKDEIAQIPGAVPTARFIPSPSCVQDIDALLTDQKNWFGFYKSSATLTASVPIEVMREGINRYFVMELRAERSMGVSAIVEVTYSPSDLNKYKSTSVDLTTQDEHGHKTLLFRQTISLCK